VSLSTVLLVVLIAGLALALAFVLWKARYTHAVRQDAIQRSLAVTTGKVYEQLLPYFPDFPFNPKDVRFLGSPVDFVVFEGLSDGQVSRVVFVEIKTGTADLSSRERRVREAVRERRVEWRELRLDENLRSHMEDR
jgi:predicted Holliday junction resolvase-like endonuclease